jgi:hypothetical protein
VSLGAAVFDDESDADGEPDGERVKLGEALTLPLMQTVWDSVFVTVALTVAVVDADVHTVGDVVVAALTVAGADSEPCAVPVIIEAVGSSE